MKKLILFLLTVVLCLSSPSCFGLKGLMIHYFDDWKPETNADLVYEILDLYSIYFPDPRDENELFNLRESGPIAFPVVLGMIEGRLYFSYAYKESYFIASVDKEGKNLQVHFSSEEDLGNFQIMDMAAAGSYEKLGPFENYCYIGVMCYNEKIYIKGRNGNYVFDPTTESVQPISAFPGRYTWEIADDRQTLWIRDIEDGTERTVTLETMANSNQYAKRLLELTDQEVIGVGSSLCKLFCRVKNIDDTLYIVCEVLNTWGEAFAVLFQYDLCSDQVFFVSHYFTGDSVSSHYHFAPVYGE